VNKFYTDASEEPDDPADDPTHGLGRAEGFLLMGIVGLNQGLVNLASLLQTKDFKPQHYEMFMIKASCLQAQYDLMKEAYPDVSSG
jgi:hypothetical protein